jgi:hypothetical protein
VLDDNQSLVKHNMVLPQWQELWAKRVAKYPETKFLTDDKLVFAHPKKVNPPTLFQNYP